MLFRSSWISVEEWSDAFIASIQKMQAIDEYSKFFYCNDVKLGVDDILLHALTLFQSTFKELYYGAMWASPKDAIILEVDILQDSENKISFACTKNDIYIYTPILYNMAQMGVFGEIKEYAPTIGELIGDKLYEVELKYANALKIKVSNGVDFTVDMRSKDGDVLSGIIQNAKQSFVDENVAKMTQIGRAHV